MKVGTDGDLPCASVRRQSSTWGKGKNHNMIWLQTGKLTLYRISLDLKYWWLQISWSHWGVWTVPWWLPPAGTSPYLLLSNFPPETSLPPPLQWVWQGSIQHASPSQTGHCQGAHEVCNIKGYNHTKLYMRCICICDGIVLVPDPPMRTWEGLVLRLAMG